MQYTNKTVLLAKLVSLKSVNYVFFYLKINSYILYPSPRLILIFKLFDLNLKNKDMKYVSMQTLSIIDDFSYYAD